MFWKVQRHLGSRGGTGIQERDEIGSGDFTDERARPGFSQPAKF